MDWTGLDMHVQHHAYSMHNLSCQHVTGSRCMRIN